MADGIQLGRRYQCDVCGSMVLCTKAGDGMVECCDATMELQQPRKLPVRKPRRGRRSSPATNTGVT